MAERLQRYLARAGVASRRAAEALISAGRVTVNNQLANTLGTKVEPNDLVAVDGKLVMPPEGVSWYILYKPPAVVTTLEDPQGRPTIRGFLQGITTRVFPIGRLDWDAEGALLLTDDGAAAHRLLHPSFQVPRTYLAKVKGIPTDEGLARLVAGVRLEDGPARALEVERFQATERNTWLRVTVGEGRPHLVKRLCAAIGHPVVRLYRPHQAGISVAGMQPGELRPLRPEELAVVEAVAAGQPVPPVTLGLPPRRHGRADEDAEAEGDIPRRPPKASSPGGGASGTRGAFATPARGPGRGPPSPGRPRGRPFRRGEGTGVPPRGPRQGLPEGRPSFQRTGQAPPDAASRRPPRGDRDFRERAAGGARSQPPGAPTGFRPERGSLREGPSGPPRRGGRDVQAAASSGRWAGARTGRPGAPKGFQRTGASPRDGRPPGPRGGRDFQGKPGGWAGGRGPSRSHQGFEDGATSARGGRPRPPPRGGRDFQKKPGTGGWAGGRSGPPRAPNSFQRGGASSRDAPSGPPQRGRPDFRGKPPEGGRGKPAWRGVSRPPEGGRPSSTAPRQRPPRGGWAGAGRGSGGPRRGPSGDGGRPGRGGPRRPVDRKPGGPRR